MAHRIADDAEVACVYESDEESIEQMREDREEVNDIARLMELPQETQDQGVSPLQQQLDTESRVTSADTTTDGSVEEEGFEDEMGLQSQQKPRRLPLHRVDSLGHRVTSFEDIFEFEPDELNS